MTKSEQDNPTTFIRPDFEEIEPENIPDIAIALLALLEIALLNKKNKTWLKEQQQKEQKKLSK
jgi:hypothetical protein